MLLVERVKSCTIRSVCKEWFCLSESFRLVKRDRGYLSVVVPLYLAGLRHGAHGRLLRHVYFLLRHLDDIIDGDIDSDVDIDVYVDSIVDILCFKERQASSSLRGAAQKFSFAIRGEFKILEKKKFMILTELISLVELMKLDRIRSRTSLLLSSVHLRQYHLSTFLKCLNIAFSALNSPTRATEVRCLAEAQYRLYNLRDLEEDLSKGLVNIPSEVIRNTVENTEISLSFKIEDLQKNSAFRKWLRKEFLDGCGYLREAEAFLEESTDRRVVHIVAPLVFGLRRIENRLLRIFDYAL